MSGLVEKSLQLYAAEIIFMKRKRYGVHFPLCTDTNLGDFYLLLQFDFKKQCWTLEIKLETIHVIFFVSITENCQVVK
jgi:hypothetical protein